LQAGSENDDNSDTIRFPIYCDPYSRQLSAGFLFNVAVEQGRRQVSPVD